MQRQIIYWSRMAFCQSTKMMWTIATTVSPDQKYEMMRDIRKIYKIYINCSHPEWRTSQTKKIMRVACTSPSNRKGQSVHNRASFHGDMSAHLIQFCVWKRNLHKHCLLRGPEHFRSEFIHSRTRPLNTHLPKTRETRTKFKFRSRLNRIEMLMKPKWMKK